MSAVCACPQVVVRWLVCDFGAVVQGFDELAVGIYFPVLGNMGCHIKVPVFAFRALFHDIIPFCCVGA